MTIGQDVTIGRYLTPETIRLGLSGFVAGSAAGLWWRLTGRHRWGAAPVMVALLFAAGLGGRSDWPEDGGIVVAGAMVTILAGAGAASLLGAPGLNWGWVAVGSLISTLGVWAGVPETGPAVLAGGALVGLAATAALTGCHWRPAAGLGVAAAITWAALSGAAGRPWAAVGGALCTGLAPWVALRRLFDKGPRRCRAPALLGAHLVLVLLASRWIAVDPHPGWGRVAIVAAGGLVVAVTAGRRA